MARRGRDGRRRGGDAVPPGDAWSAGDARSVRQLRVGEAVRHALADVFQREDFRDPALAGKSITVTEVRVSPDLRAATVFFMPLGQAGESDLRGVALGLDRVSGFLRGRIAKAVPLRLVPVLSFKPDESFDRAARVAGLLRSPDVARDLAPADPDPAADGTSSPAAR